MYTGSEGVALRVAIYAEKLNLRNFWAGAWLSLWELARGDASGGGDGWVLSGRVTVRAHCFEDGNMQMTTAKPCPPVPLDSVRTYIWVVSIERIKPMDRSIDRLTRPGSRDHHPAITIHSPCRWARPSSRPLAASRRDCRCVGCRMMIHRTRILRPDQLISTNQSIHETDTGSAPSTPPTPS